MLEQLPPNRAPQKSTGLHELVASVQSIAWIELRRTGPLPITRRSNVLAIPFRPRSHEMIIGLIGIRRASHIFLLALLWACLCSAAHAKRKDVVIMNNGDHFTGEVKRLANGLLFVETDYVAGNIGLDWNQVESVQSTATYRIVLNNGKRIEGKIEKVSRENAKEADFLIREATEEVQIPSAEIVSMETKKPTFWRQLQGSMDLGYSYSSGNSQTALDVNTNAAYRTPGWEATTAYDSTFGGQAGASKTNRQDFQATFAKYLNRNSYLLALSDFLHSSRQDLTLRTTLGGGYGRYLKRTTNTNLSWIAGVVFVNESFDVTAAQPSDQSAEALVGLQYSMIRFNFGEFDSQLLTFPGLTDTGRIRVTTNNALTIKLRNNFHLAFTFWDNFDSRPPATAKRNELGVSSGIGWSF
jgi:putative salt-induced outer membrane protein YdiY